MAANRGIDRSPASTHSGEVFRAKKGGGGFNSAAGMRIRNVSPRFLQKTILKRLAQLSQHAPRGKKRLARLFLRLASTPESTPSLYGPVLQTRWNDLTFQFCIFGEYGTYLSNFLRELSYAYSFIDIGANAGLYSLIAAENPHCVKCYAFEPNPTVYESLKTNIDLNNATKIKALNYAISDIEGLGQFIANDAHTGAGRLVGSAAEGISVKTVNARMFDNIAIYDRLPKIVKIDVEGHEPVVIGELMKSSIWNDIRYLYFEVNANRYDEKPIVERLHASRFKLVCRIAQGDDANLMFGRLN